MPATGQAQFLGPKISTIDGISLTESQGPPVYPAEQTWECR